MKSFFSSKGAYSPLKNVDKEGEAVELGEQKVPAR
jgi:hypothetical protein